MTKNPKANKLFGNAKHWGKEANVLREILLECNLTEEIKWRSPCYTHNGKIFASSREWSASSHSCSSRVHY